MLHSSYQSTPRRASAVGPVVMAGDAQTHKMEAYAEGNLKVHQIIDSPDNTEIMALRYSQDGSILAIGHADGTIRMCNPDSGVCLHVLSDDDTKKRKLAVTSIRFKAYNDSDRKEHKHILVATYASGLIKFWHYTSGKCIHTTSENRQTLSSAFNPYGSAFITCGSDPQLHMYDVATMKVIQTLEPSDSRDVMNGHRARVFAIQYHPGQPHMFVTGGWDDTLQFWDDRQQHAIRKMYGPHICGDALDIDGNHGHIVTGSWRKHKVLQIWDFDTDLIKDVPEDPMHRSLLYCAQWLGKENIVCGGCDQNMVRIIDRGTLNTVGQLIDLPSGVFSIDNDHQAKPKVAAASANEVYILKLEKRQ